MGADIVAIVPELNDPTWIAWKDEQITALARIHRPGTPMFRQGEKNLYTALTSAFNSQLDQWHTWEWDHALGGEITLDRRAPIKHPYLGTVPAGANTKEALVRAEQDLLAAALADATARLRTLRSQ